MWFVRFGSGFGESSLHEKCAFSLHVSLQQQQQQQQRHHQQAQQGGAGGSNAGRDGGASGSMDVSEVRDGFEVACSCGELWSGVFHFFQGWSVNILKWDVKFVRWGLKIVGRCVRIVRWGVITVRWGVGGCVVGVIGFEMYDNAAPVPVGRRRSCLLTGGQPVKDVHTKNCILTSKTG